MEAPAQQQQQQQKQQRSQQMSLEQHHQHEHRTNSHLLLKHANSMPYPASAAAANIIQGNTTLPPPLIGPRGKCDQVIYEAMTKACEIVVRGRCTNLDWNEQRRLMFQTTDGMVNSAASNNNGSSSSSRFNIQLDEVPSIRSILQTWKRALNAPLRLDIFYEYTDGNCGGEVQRELLERWCIDYKNVNSASSKGMTGVTTLSTSAAAAAASSSSSASQLRLVCKRIVVLLRNLHCMTRILPAYRLHSLIDNASGIGGGDGGGGGGGMIRNNDNNGISGGSTSGVRMGIIGYSIYASDYEPNGPMLPSPSFTQQSFPSVKTPFGTLGLSVMYDATLNPYQMVEGVVERALLLGENELWNQQQLLQQEQQQQWQEGGVCLEGEGGQQQQQVTLPIPVPLETISTSSQGLANLLEGGSTREFGSCPTNHLMGRSRSSSLGGGGRTRALSDIIITDYHSSPAMRPRPLPVVGSSGVSGNEKRIMSGLSLAMMADENSQQQQQQQQQCPTDGGLQLSPDEYSEQDDTVMQHTWGSLATRAAFHHPPPTYESCDFFQYHGGYGYGYNGSQLQLNSDELSSPLPPVASAASSRANDDNICMSPSPLMSTPPPHYSSWMKRNQSATGTPTPTSLKENFGDTQNSEQDDKDEHAPPFVNPTTLQALPAFGSLSGAPASPSTQAARHLDHASSSVDSSPRHRDIRHDNYRRQSSSSVLLPPVTSLDLLQKSPFTATKSNAEERDEDNLAMPFTLGSYRDEMFMSSIPNLAAAGTKSRMSNLAGSTSGAVNPFMASFGQSSSGGYYSTGPFASRREIHGFSQSEPTDEVEEMPFALALDEDGPFRSSKALLGSTSGLASSSLALSSLHQRCDQGKPRLKMFSSTRTRIRGIRNDGDMELDKDSTSADYSSIKDQLSEFRTWHSASLMVDSASK